MTGIERLRQFAKGCRLIGQKAYSNAIDDIADQIEREQGGRVSRMRVVAVATEMERHVSGVEGMEDSPVARWARELREALGGDGRDHAADVYVSAYDLLPAEDRDAIAWVREHGGLDAVKAEWRSRVPYDRYERRRQRLLDHIAECETALGRRNERIEELGKTIEFYQLNNSNFRHLLADVAERLGFTRYGDDYEPEDLLDALDRRLMPEGMEWPRYEDGEPVRFGDVVSDGDETGRVYYVTFDTVNPVIIGFTDETPDQDHGTWLEVSVNDGERVKRPTPKVLDADGVEIHAGDRVWSIQLDEPHEWTVIEPDDGTGFVLVRVGDDIKARAKPENLTHRAPVLAADGEPLEVGQTVWSVNDGTEYKVGEIRDTTDEDGDPCKIIGCSNDELHIYCAYLPPEKLTHQLPVLDADGVLIKVGDTVYEVGENYPPFIVGRLPEPGAYRSVRVVYPSGAFTYLDPERLTHTKPEPPDSWERIEEDADALVDAEINGEGSYNAANAYCNRRGLGEGTSFVLMAQDLVRRCRALAEREQS